MSLLMLKTKNLTHQDHILNFELMLNPMRSGLLLNKHRSLESKRDKEKEICEVEKQFAISKFNVEKRLIDRRKAKLMDRASKRTYYTPTPFSTFAVRDVETPQTDEGSMSTTVTRAASAPPKRGFGAPSNIAPFKYDGKTGSSKKSRSLSTPNNRQPFLSGRRPKTTGTGRTGGFIQNAPSAWLNNSAGDLVDQQSRRGFSGSKIKHSNQGIRLNSSQGYMSTGFGTPSSNNNWLQRNAPNQRGTFQGEQKASSVTFLTESGPFQSVPTIVIQSDEDPNGTTADSKSETPSTKTDTLKMALLDEQENNTKLKGRVGDFLGRMEDFKTRPVNAEQDLKVEKPWLVRRLSSNTTATVAKRYDQLSLDVQRLHTAFDNLCVERNPEELQKIVKLASKLKSNVKYARNVSMVPVIGTIRSKKKFVEMASYKSAPH